MIPPLANRFVAGETTAAALDHAREMNERGVGVLCNLLGEHYDERGPADADTDAYLELLDDLAGTDLDACLTVKPSQLGLDVGESVFRGNLARVVERANADDCDRFVWIDMEDHTTTDATLDAFEHHAREHGDVGVCVQANLRRTPEDLERIADLPETGWKVRLVKGAYDPPRDVGFCDGDRVNRAYRECLESTFAAFDDGVAVGSHDPAMVEYAAELHEEHGTPYEVQMLMGVREDAQVDLATDREVRQYVPFGDRWLSYFYRRVLERKENVIFALRAVLGG